jgi:hypothetical protein
MKRSTVGDLRPQIRPATGPARTKNGKNEKPTSLNRYANPGKINNLKNTQFGAEGFRQSLDAATIRGIPNWRR